MHPNTTSHGVPVDPSTRPGLLPAFGLAGEGATLALYPAVLVRRGLACGPDCPVVAVASELPADRPARPAAPVGALAVLTQVRHESHAVPFTAALITETAADGSRPRLRLVLGRQQASVVLDLDTPQERGAPLPADAYRDALRRVVDFTGGDQALLALPL